MGERPGATLLGKTSRSEDSVGTTCYVSFHTPLLDIGQHRRAWSPPQDVFSQLLNVFKHNWYLINPVALSTDLRTFLSLYSQLPFSDFISGIFPLPRFESGTRFTLSLSSSFHPSRSFLSLFSVILFPSWCVVFSLFPVFFSVHIHVLQPYLFFPALSHLTSGLQLAMELDKLMTDIRNRMYFKSTSIKILLPY